MSGKKKQSNMYLALVESFDDDVYVLQHTDGEQEENRMLLYEPIEGIPVGLEPLLNCTSISFTKGLPLSVHFDVVVNRHYNITNQTGQKIYHAGEKTNHCKDCCCNGHRAFCLRFFNGHGKTVMKATQECTRSMIWSHGECTGANLTLTLGNEQIVGRIIQKYSCWYPKYDIQDSKRTTIMRVIGPGGGVWTQICGRKFKVSLSGISYGNKTQEIAHIDERTVFMPHDLSVYNKAMLLCCLLIIELDYYQSSRTYGKVLAVFTLLFVALIYWDLIHPDD